MICEQPDFTFPMQADIFYPIVDQGVYGNVKKQWVVDRTIIGNFTPPSRVSKGREEITPDVNITQKGILIGRVKNDIRISSKENDNSITNIIISNIKDRYSNEVYIETSGPRKGKSTIYEVATQEPYMGPFGKIEYYNIVLRRSENQAVDA
jgi:hypothetical protein